MQIAENLSICIPAFNESRAIVDTLRHLRSTVPAAEIIVVDDGSSDGTGELASSVEGVTVITHTRNKGYGASLKTAMLQSSRSIVAWYDADGQHRVEDLVNVARSILEEGKDAVIGVRTKDSKVQRNRVFGKMVLKFIAKALARENIPDLNSGLRCFRRDVVLRYLHLLPDGFSASSTTTMLLIKRGYNTGHVPILALERIGVSTVKHLRDGWRTIHLLLRLLVLFEAFSVFAALAAVQFVIAMAYSLFIVFTVGQGLPVLGAVILLSSILTFFMGLICDQIVALRLERLEGSPVAPVVVAPLSSKGKGEGE